MQTREQALFAEYKFREQNEELVGVLTAISIVSKRLAKSIAALEHRREEKGGDDIDVPRKKRRKSSG